MDDVKRNVVRKDDFKRLAPQFEVFFHVFISRHAIQEQKQRDKMAKLASQPESTPFVVHFYYHWNKKSSSKSHFSPRKRSLPTFDTISSISEPKTPDQPTHPANPNLTSSTVESNDQDHIKELLPLFIMNTMSVLEAGFRTIHWLRSGNHVDLVKT